MLNGSHMDAHRIYYLTAVHLIKIKRFLNNSRPRDVNMLQTPRYLNPELSTMFSKGPKQPL